MGHWKTERGPFFALGLLLSVFLSFSLFAQDQTSSAGQPKPAGAESESQTADESLQKAVQNPVASLISVPLQNNTNFGYGPFNRTQDVLNIQPVIPINISKDWMVISRIIQPLVWQPYPH
jgi:hypothetical protein